MNETGDQLLPCIIQLTLGDSGGPTPVLDLLRGLGVKLDDAYGVVPVDPSHNAFVTRGLVPEELVSEIEEDERIALYPEMGLRPL